VTTDTDALLATVREALACGNNHSMTKKEEEAWFAAPAALDSLAAELERMRVNEDSWRQTAKGHRAARETAEAELERVKAERDELRSALAEQSDGDFGRVQAAEARLDKALSALREIGEAAIQTPGQVVMSRDIARRCLAEIEGEA